MNSQAEIIGVLAIAGFSGAFYSYYKSGPISLWMPLAYFSLMGFLQAFSHTIADQCGLPANQVATLLAYFHLCFQPFFINAVALYFIEKRVAGTIDIYVYALCFTALIMMLIQVYPFAWAGRCNPGSLMCGETLCTLHESWRLSWLVPATKFMDYIPWYFICALILPVIYGSWRFMLATMVFCLFPAYLMTQSMNEWPAVMALLMIPFLLLVNALSEIRRHMVITCWPGWRTIAAGS